MVVLTRKARADALGVHVACLDPDLLVMIVGMRLSVPLRAAMMQARGCRCAGVQVQVCSAQAHTVNLNS